jgi:hypothetical protein
MTIHLTQAVMESRCCHCGRLLGYRTCDPQARGHITHGMCLPFCDEAVAAGWTRELEKPLLASRPWLKEGGCQDVA